MTLARRFVWELIVLGLIGVMPCATAGGRWQGGSVVDDDARTGADASLSSAVDLTGRWEGTWHSQGGAAGSSLTALLTQVEASLTGVVTIPDVACLPAGTVSGSVDGDTVVFGVVSAEAVQADFAGTVVDSGLSMQGSYDVHDAGCAVDVGTWQLVKVAEPCDANGDGTIDRRDAGDLLRFLLGRQPSLAGYADCNKDGTVNFRDVMAILQSR